jgi:hypothetical protein
LTSQLCRYSVLRYVPSENREEFINIGLLFHSPKDGYVNLEITKNFGRVTAFDDEIDINFLKIVLEGIQNDFSLSTVNGPSPESVFNWNFIEASTSIFVNQIQFSPVKTIRSSNIYEDEEKLFKTYVYFDVKKNKRITEDEVRSIMNRVFRKNDVFKKLNRNISVDIGPENIKLDYGLKSRTNKTRIIKTLSFDYSKQNSNRATQIAKEWVWNFSKIEELNKKRTLNILEFENSMELEFTTLVYFREQNKNIKTALSILKEFSNTIEANTENSIESFATKIVNETK